MTRIRTLLVLVAAAACKGTTEPATPSAPSLTAVVTYTVGGTAQLSGSQGYWFKGTVGAVPMVKVVAFSSTATPPDTDATRPTLDEVDITLVGPPFGTFPLDVTVSPGVDGNESIGVQASRIFAYPLDSGTVAITRLGGGYVRVALSVRGPLFSVSGVLQVPQAGP